MLPEHIEAVQEWLQRARLDDASADRLLSIQPPIIETALFHCQQLAEKALKAYLVCYNRPFRRTHDLVELVSLCATLDATFSSLAGIAHELAPYAVTFRYPTEEPTPSLEQAQQRLQWARQVWSFVMDRLPPDVRA